MEVYGTKPPRFTKEWWGYFWDYYKWHTIGGIIAIIVAISSISECAHQINYDLQVDYITENGISLEQEDSIRELIEKNIDDVTENGKKEAMLTYIDLGHEDDAQLHEAMQTKFMIEAGYSEGYVFIVTKKYADYFKDSGIFMDAAKWTDKESYDGYFVSLKDSKLLQSTGLDTEDLYAAVLITRSSNAKDKLHDKKQENGIKFASRLINGE